MSIRSDGEPRWVFDTSSIVEPGIRIHLEQIINWASELTSAEYQLGSDGCYLDQFDRPYILLPPCWGELKEAHRILRELHPYSASKLKDTLNMLDKLVDKDFVTTVDTDDLSYGETLNDRKLAWLVQIKDTLEKKGKKILFHSENPLLLIRASIARINCCTAQQQLRELIPSCVWKEWSLDGHPDEKVWIVDEKFLISRKGERIAGRLCVVRGMEKGTDRLFLTREIQEFAQANQFNWDGETIYPFTCLDLFSLDFASSNYPARSSVCKVPKNHRELVGYEVEMCSLLDEAVQFQKIYGYITIGEPYGSESEDGIFLDQIPESTSIYIVAADQKWAMDIAGKVQKSRPTTKLTIMTLEEAGEFLGIPAENKETDVFSDDLAIYPALNESPTDEATGKRGEVSFGKLSWEADSGSSFADDDKRKKMDVKAGDSNGGSEAQIGDSADGGPLPADGLPTVSA